MNCRFEIKEKFSGLFYCAVIKGPNGWAYMWKHNGLNDPCINCSYKITGKQTIIDYKMTPDKFFDLAGRLIREKDWKEFDRRGYKRHV